MRTTPTGQLARYGYGDNAGRVPTMQTRIRSKVHYAIIGSAKLPYDRWDDWQKGANSWHIQLRYRGRRISSDFWTGSLWTGANGNGEPTAADMLESLLNDAQTVQWESFEGWCADLGYDTDSRKAERMYAACERMAVKLERFLGDDFTDAMDDPEAWCKVHCAVDPS